MEEGEKSRIWGYPALYWQFALEVLPAMRAVDELRSRPLQVQQQSQDLTEGFGPPTVASLPLHSSIIRSEDMLERAEPGEVRVPSATGLASDSDGKRVTGRVSSDGTTNTLDQIPASINSAIDPISADGVGDIAKVHFAPHSTLEEQASDEDDGKSWEDEKDGELSQVRTQDMQSSPIPLETDMEVQDADRGRESDL